MAQRDIVAIGGSAGSTVGLKEIVRRLPADFPGSVFITTHMPSQYRSHMPDILAQMSPLPVVRAVDGAPVETGRIYTAEADRHLLVLDSTIRLGVGPRENLARPAIDPLFRSLALSYGPRVVGVVLSGLLNDGASGLRAITAAGGRAVVQNPLEAAEDEMPRAAMAATEVDCLAAADRIADILCDLAGQAAPAPRPAPDRLLLEVEIANGGPLDSRLVRRLADPVAITCPDCAGVLSEVRDDKPLRYRCQTGHAYTAKVLAARDDLVDGALRVALRIIEERVELVERMAREARDSGRALTAEHYEARGAEHRRHAEILREAALKTLRGDHEVPEPLA